MAAIAKALLNSSLAWAGKPIAVTATATGAAAEAEAALPRIAARRGLAAAFATQVALELDLASALRPQKL